MQYCVYIQTVSMHKKPGYAGKNRPTGKIRAAAGAGLPSPIAAKTKKGHILLILLHTLFKIVMSVLNG